MNDVVQLNVNGETVEVAAGTTVSDVVRAVGCGTRGVAVAVNHEVVRRGAWTELELTDGDQVEILHAVAGG